MSYCRWSSDDFQCDVYVYESTRGYETHVAAFRHTFTGDLPEPAPNGDTAAWVERHARVLDLLGDTHPIGLSLDGQTFVDETPGECADTLERIRAAGYNVPQYAIDDLRAEAATPERTDEA